MSRVRLINVVMVAGVVLLAYGILSEPSEFFYELPRDAAKLAAFNDARFWCSVASSVGMVVFVVAFSLRLFNKENSHKHSD